MELNEEPVETATNFYADQDARPTNLSKVDQCKFLGMGYFINPFCLAAVVVLAVNDHYLKRAHPSFLTGKLSDFAGVFFFPLLLCAIWNGVKNLVTLSRRHWISKIQLVVTVMLTDLIFAGVKFVPRITDLYLSCMRALGYPSRVTPDWTDLSAFSMNLLTFWYINKFYFDSK